MNPYTETVESNHERGSLLAFVAGAAIGATVGAATALILAPASGRDTRAYLKRRGQELGHDAMERGRETLEAQLSHAKSAAAAGWERTADAINYVRERGEAAYRDARASMQAGPPELVHASRAPRVSE